LSSKITTKIVDFYEKSFFPPQKQGKNVPGVQPDPEG
jgi:hypothetical protein